jgi:predicted dehydrogenase
MDQTRVRWGVLGVARVATNRMIPAAKQCKYAEIVGIASRDFAKAKAAAEQFGIERSYGCYEELLTDSSISGIYIPLPNHLHPKWTLLAARAGKHVLCEKPIALSSCEVEELIRVRDETRVRIGEAFAARTHPRWLRLRELIAQGKIGTLRAVTAYFSIPLNDVSNIRYNADWGGGVLADLGSHLIYLSRLLFGEEPQRVVALSDRHPQTGVDRTTSMLLDFPSGGQACLNCSFDTAWGQKIFLVGTKARIEVENPVAAPDSRPTRLTIDDGSNSFGESAVVEEFAPCNPFAVELDAFSRAILENSAGPLPHGHSSAEPLHLQAPMNRDREGADIVTLEDSLGNVRALEAALLSAKTLQWVRVN